MNLKPQKYFDHNKGERIHLTKDGCDLKNWDKEYGTATFANHPKGFLIFLSPDKLNISDEYLDSDPYSVADSIDDDFHQRRIKCTIDMVKKACLNIDGVPAILDIGCGQGHITNEIYKAIPDSEITGIDYSISAIEYAVDHFAEIDFAVGDAYDCPYSKDYFDVIVCNNLWEHVPDPLFLLRKISKILKPNGYIIISTPSRYRLKNLIRIVLGLPITFMSSQHVTEYSVGQVIEQLQYGGYTVDDIFSQAIKNKDIKMRLAKVLFSLPLYLSGSHHQLESTVFYLAQHRKSSSS